MGYSPEEKRAYNAVYYAAHRFDAGTIAKRAKYYVEHRERLLVYAADRRVANPDYAATYRAEHPEKVKAGRKAWRDANPEMERASARRRYAANPEEARARSLAWAAAHPEKCRTWHAAWSSSHPAECCAHTARHRALMRETTSGDPKAIAKIYRQARENKKIRCYLCGKWIPMGERHVDHIVPLSRGGEHTASNLAIVHKSCNLKKHNKLPEEIGMLL